MRDHFRELLVAFDFIPPTENNIRVVRFGGKGLAWTTEAKEFKKKVKNIVRANYWVESAVFSRGHLPDSIYYVQIIIEMPLLNSTYKPGRKSGAKYRYKKTDLTNRRKLLEDAMSEVLSIDDSLFFEVSMVKVHSEVERLQVYIAEIDDLETYGVSL